MSNHPSLLDLSDRLDWLTSGNMRPYILARKSNRIQNPGEKFSLHWFPHEPFFMDALVINDVYFSDALMNMEARAFAEADMAMPRWVFYDCAIMPGFVSGFAMRTEAVPQSIAKILGPENMKGEWTPISMFIVIPTMREGEWVAHNLSSINSLVGPNERYYGLGFLSKAFGLAYANIEVCCGITQWQSPAMRLHSYYGFFEILTAYTPAHQYSRTLTYRLNVNPEQWKYFFTKQESAEFYDKFEPAGILLDTNDDRQLIDLHMKVQAGEGPFFLDANEIRSKQLDDNLTIYRRKTEG
ncbi:MAG: hypothetical protein CL675_00145 [Bdellovibrionaceae bacterium]|nr:hypothetical protein [Pseudobdellovibrionaceae bacterium]